MTNLTIASRLFNVPLLVLPTKLDAVIFGMQKSLGVVVEKAPEPNMYLTAIGERREPGYRVVDGVAIIEVFGGLLHRGEMQADSTYLLGYQEIARRLDAALSDTSVHTLLFICDSPGGEVAGVFDLAEKIYKARGLKRIVASISDMACSACYLIAAACEEVYASETACVGSIGVVMRHVDISKYVEEMGYVITHIFVGDHKVDGNQFEPLPADVRARYQEISFKFYNLFTGRVSTYRDVDEKSIIDTQAKVYIGDESLGAGLIDGIETPDETLSRLTSERGDAGSRRTTTDMETQQMSTKKTTPTAEDKKPAVKASTSEPVKTEKTESTAAKSETDKPPTSVSEVTDKDTAKAERERIKTIMNCDAAKTNMKQAEHLAYETDMPAEAAVDILKAGASAVKPAASKLDDAMGKTRQPNVSQEGEQVELSDTQQILTDLNAARGNKTGAK